jgi:hypothetical protein
VPKHVGILVLIVSCITLSVFVGWYTDCKNTHVADTTKFAIAKRAKAVCNVKNTKEKLHKTNVAMWFNKVREIERRTPKYMQIHVTNVLRLYSFAL